MERDNVKQNKSRHCSLTSLTFKSTVQHAKYSTDTVFWKLKMHFFCSPNQSQRQRTSCVKESPRNNPVKSPEIPTPPDTPSAISSGDSKLRFSFNDKYCDMQSSVYLSDWHCKIPSVKNTVYWCMAFQMKCTKIYQGSMCSYYNLEIWHLNAFFTNMVHVFH